MFYDGVKIIPFKLSPSVTCPRSESLFTRISFWRALFRGRRLHLGVLQGAVVGRGTRVQPRLVKSFAGGPIKKNRILIRFPD